MFTESSTRNRKKPLLFHVALVIIVANEGLDKGLNTPTALVLNRGLIYLKSNCRWKSYEELFRICSRKWVLANQLCVFLRFNRTLYVLLEFPGLIVLNCCLFDEYLINNWIVSECTYFWITYLGLYSGPIVDHVL